VSDDEHDGYAERSRCEHELRRLAEAVGDHVYRTDATVNNALHLILHGHTAEQALIVCVRALSESNERLLKMATAMAAARPAFIPWQEEPR